MRPLFSLLFLCFTLFLYGQSISTAYSIKGFLPYWKGALFTLSVDGIPVQSLTLQQDVYSYTGQTTQAKTGLLEIKDGGKPRFLPFFIEPGVIRIRDKGGKRLEVYGTPTNDAFLALTRSFDSLVLNVRNGSAGEVMVTKKSLAKNFIRENPRSIISLQLLHDCFFLPNSVNDTVYANLFYELDTALQQTTLGQKIGREIVVSSQSALGARAAPIVLPDSSGTLRPVYTQGKYTLVHFWASWCVPCKKEFPGFLEVHRRFAPLGFSMTGVSLDRNLLAWKQPARKLPWKQLIDVESFTGEAAMKYGIKVVPMNLLLDPEGTIIAKNLSIPDLEKRLTELYQDDIRL
jgi:thiol-disulfide isomerase/thioredoxin